VVAASPIIGLAATTNEEGLGGYFPRVRSQGFATLGSDMNAVGVQDRRLIAEVILECLNAF
jgi:hypothetical protein